MTDTRWQVVAYIFASMVLWLVAAQLVRRRAAIPWIRSLSDGWAASILRFAYYAGLPYAALVLGVVPGRYLGLVGQARKASPLSFESIPDAWQLLLQVQGSISLVILDWLPDMGKVAGLAILMLLLLSATWLGYAYAWRSVVSSLGIDTVSLRRGEKLSGVRVLYQAIHWSFYRGAVWLLADDLYLGVVGGIVLVIGEWMLVPGRTDRRRHSLSSEVRLLDASVLIATSVIFLFVPNLWLLAPIHWMLAIASRRMAASGQWRLSDSRL
ncbi:MAG: hypothetical protein JSV81_15745 [Anaerolineales bacterium]|nr:MAG: hypothetical protein JSV81_15745 [Anaerolineales bacterium]